MRVNHQYTRTGLSLLNGLLVGGAMGVILLAILSVVGAGIASLALGPVAVPFLFVGGFALFNAFKMARDSWRRSKYDQAQYDYFTKKKQELETELSAAGLDLEKAPSKKRASNDGVWSAFHATATGLAATGITSTWVAYGIVGFGAFVTAPILFPLITVGTLSSWANTKLAQHDETRWQDKKARVEAAQAKLEAYYKSNPDKRPQSGTYSEVSPEPTLSPAPSDLKFHGFLKKAAGIAFMGLSWAFHGAGVGFSCGNAAILVLTAFGVGLSSAASFGLPLGIGLACIVLFSVKGFIKQLYKERKIRALQETVTALSSKVVTKTERLEAEPQFKQKPTPPDGGLGKGVLATEETPKKPNPWFSDTLYNTCRAVFKTSGLTNLFDNVTKLRDHSSSHPENAYEKTHLQAVPTTVLCVTCTGSIITALGSFLFARFQDNKIARLEVKKQAYQTSTPMKKRADSGVGSPTDIQPGGAGLGGSFYNN